MIVIGIDPSIADGKPLAAVTLDVEALRLIPDPSWFRFDRMTDSWGCDLRSKYDQWLAYLDNLISLKKPDLIAIEDSRGVGGKGSAHLQTLVTLLKEQAEALGVPVILVKPSEAKAAVRKGNSTKVEIAETIRALMDCTALPDGYDWTDAVAVALAGERKWQWEQAKKGGE